MSLLNTIKNNFLKLLLSLVVSVWFFSWYVFPTNTANLMIDVYRYKSGLIKKSVDVNGHTNVYLEGGSLGIPIVMIHGLGGTKENYIKFVPYLEKKHVIIPDLSGQGESERLDDANFDIDSQVERLHSFMRSIGIEKFHIIGNSMGGLIAGTYAIKYPEEVVSLGIFAGAGVKSKEPSELEKMHERGENPFNINKQEDVDRFVSMAYYKPPTLPYPLKAKALDAAISNKALNLKIFESIVPDAFSLESRLGEIKSPTLIVWGKEDQLLDVSMVEAYEKGLKRSKTILLDKCGHAPMNEKSKETAEAYLDFLKTINSK